MHDLGFIATTRTENGKERRGFAMYVGGGLGAVAYQAKLFDSFVPVEEMLPKARKETASQKCSCSASGRSEDRLSKASQSLLSGSIAGRLSLRVPDITPIA